MVVGVGVGEGVVVGAGVVGAGVAADMGADELNKSIGQGPLQHGLAALLRLAL